MDPGERQDIQKERLSHEKTQKQGSREYFGKCQDDKYIRNIVF